MSGAPTSQPAAFPACLDELLVSIDGQKVAPRDARVSIFDHGFLFGDSVYEVVRTLDGHFLAWDLHWERLIASAAGIGMSLPFSSEQMHAEALELLADAEFPDEAYLRMIVTRGVGDLNLDPASCEHPGRVMIARAMRPPPAPAYDSGVRLSLVSLQRNSKRATNPGIKSGNYLNNVLAFAEARRSNAFEALMLNEHGYLTECTTANIFLVQGGVIRTPSLDCGLLAGITRAIVLELAQRGGLATEETVLKEEDLWSAEEVFITSSTRDVVPVAAIDEHKLAAAPGPVTARLMRLFQDGVRGWLDPVPALRHRRVRR